MPRALNRKLEKVCFEKVAENMAVYPYTLLEIVYVLN